MDYDPLGCRHWLIEHLLCHRLRAHWNSKLSLVHYLELLGVVMMASVAVDIRSKWVHYRCCIVTRSRECDSDLCSRSSSLRNRNGFGFLSFRELHSLTIREFTTNQPRESFLVPHEVLSRLVCLRLIKRQELVLKLLFIQRGLFFYSGTGSWRADYCCFM